MICYISFSHVFPRLEWKLLDVFITINMLGNEKANKVVDKSNKQQNKRICKKN